jgi:carboxymethylenebutenolidase
MCHEGEELPPFPPIRGGADAFGEMTLVASDGVASNAFFAHPSIPSSRGVVVLPDFRGLSEFYKQLAIRFAEAGLNAVAIDYYTRDIGRDSRPAEREFYSTLLRTTDKSVVDLDIAAAVEWLRGLPGVHVDAIFTVGFCLGGSFVWQQAAAQSKLQGHVSFYGVTNYIDDALTPLMRGPMLMLIAGQDHVTSVDSVEALAARIRASGEIVETRLYENAPHAFFSEGEFHAECDDAWRTVLDFFDRYALAAT